jgi:hypothetical protein
MTSRRPPQLAVVLLERFVPDNEPLTGDLLEDWCERSDTWFWRQVLLAILTRSTLHIRTNPRMTAEAVLVATAMLALLGFHAVVAASLMNQLLVPNPLKWDPGTGWLFSVTVSCFATAVVIGRAVSRFHRDHRVAAILVCGASATIAAFVNLYLFVPNVPNQPFFPEAVMQIAVAMVFIAGLFAGIGSRSTWGSLRSV